MKAFTIIRVSSQDQLQGYGPDEQWEDDVMAVAPSLNLEVSLQYRRVIQEPATGWNRTQFEAAVREALELYHKREVEALVFPRVDRETRFVFGSISLLTEVLRQGMPVFFAREKLRLDPRDPQSVEDYLTKVIQAQAYVETMRINMIRGTRQRVQKDHRMPTGGQKFAHEYHHYRKSSRQAPSADSGRYTIKPERAAMLRALKDWVLIDGLSLKKCEDEFKERTGIKLNRATLLRILTDPINIGKVYAYRHKAVRDSQGKKHQVSVPESEWLLVYEDRDLAIFSEDEYYALKHKFQLNKENSSRNTRHHYPPLKGVVHCEPCRLKMGALTTNFGTAYYRCNSCRNYINAWSLWDKVKDDLSSFFLHPERLTATIRADYHAGKTKSHLERQLADLERDKEGWEQSRAKQRRLYLLPNSNYSEQDYLRDDGRILGQLQRVNDRITEVKQQIKGLRQVELDEEGIKRFCCIVSNNFTNMTDSQWRFLLDAMRLKITVTGKSINVEGAVPVIDGAIALQPAHR